MAKQLVILFWGAVYGEVLGYIVGDVSQATFNPVPAAIFGAIGGVVLINLLNLMVSDSSKTKN